MKRNKAKDVVGIQNVSTHTELFTERSILLLLYEIKRVFVYISAIFKLTDLFILYFFIQNVYQQKVIYKERL